MQNQEMEFRFKAVVKRDENNKPILDEKGEKVMIPAAEPIKAVVPQFTSLEDVQQSINQADEKEVKLLLDTLNELFKEQGKAQIDEDAEAVRANGLDLSKLTFNYIANIPPGVRGGAGIGEETWASFSKDYVAVMVHHGKSQAQAEFGASLFQGRFNKVKTNKKVLAALHNNLLVWAGNTSAGEEFSKIYEASISRLNTLLAADEEAIVAAV